MAFSCSAAWLCIFLILSSSILSMETRVLEQKNKLKAELGSESEGTSFEKTGSVSNSEVQKEDINSSKRLSPGGPDPQHH
ncbi:hypothetical protein AXF42_Ash003210 [Apostasia shenzhenica]|uniref:Uncharacterized protein n=1 Tax=Apostasia shenzhenica TaxID=1088818 RepID=A0A2I0BFL2_9ASPA|nr:hypothetical protein AXF42_Ash003210 [Apostasia shenzhenica]